MAVTRVKNMALAPITIKAIFHCGSKQTVGIKLKREKVTMSYLTTNTMWAFPGLKLVENYIYSKRADSQAYC